MTHYAPSGTVSPRLAQPEENSTRTENIYCPRIASAEPREVSRGLSHEGASSITAFVAGCRQVFGLTGPFLSRRFLLTSASQPNTASASIEVFVPVYRCGTVLEFHQIPYFYAGNTQRTDSIRERSTCGGVAGGRRG